MKRNRNYYRYYNKEQGYDINKIDPDIYGYNKKKAKIITQRLEQENDDTFEELDSQFIPSDTTSMAHYLIDHIMFNSKDKKRHSNKKIPRVCLLHQIYSLLKNNTMVDREMQQAVKNGTWRKFNLIGTLDDEVVIMKTNDFLVSINEAKDEFITDVKNGANVTGKDINPNLFDRFKELILDPQHFDTTVSKQSLLSGKYNFNEEEQTQLCQYGLLIPHISKDLYRFTVRGQGNFMSYYQKGRIEILRILKKRNTKDILEKLLKSKKLRQTVFSHDFLIHDLVGSGRVEKQKTTMGDLIKLTKKGELGK
ncbi:unnamed protein product [Cunninghamella blakesleeana]